MTIQDRTLDFLENLQALKFRTFITDAHKEIINFNLKLSASTHNTPYVEILNEADYNNIIKYIESEIDNPNFTFKADDYDSSKKYLYLAR